MSIPTYGAAPLAKVFILLRALEIISCIIIVGITANFTAEMVSTGASIAPEFLGALIIASLAALYCLITIPFFYADASTGLLAMFGADFLLMIGVVALAVVIGRPISYLNCQIISDEPSTGDMSSAWAFTQSIAGNSNRFNGFLDWISDTRANCYEGKAVWGVCIALSLLFSCTSLVLPALSVRKKRAVGMKGSKV